MNTNQAQISIKKINTEVVKLNPSAIVTLFEIDLTDIATAEQLSINTFFNQGTQLNSNKIFRFHNNLKLIRSSIYFGGKEFTALPIQAEGFETTSKGTAASPKLSMTSSGEGLEGESFGLFKRYLKDLGDLVGSKVVRIKTFAKHLDRINFYKSSNPSDSNYNVLWSSFAPAPDDFDPDPNAHFPPDIYFIDRKSVETKTTLEFELSSIFDMQEVKLPSRVLFQKNCTWQYRGEGCCYESSSNKINATHGNATLLNSAPPVADEKDVNILQSIRLISPSAVLTYKGRWETQKAYVIGDYVFITVNNLNYYFACKKDTSSNSPPNLTYWIQDQCSKSLAGCKLRWGASSPAQNTSINGSNPQNGNLPFGGFPGLSKE
jgi:phage-related protein